MWRRSFTSLVAFGLVACAPADDAFDYGDPLTSDGETTVDGITASVLAPSTSETQVLTLVVNASSEAGPLTARVVVGETVRRMAGTGRFTADVGLVRGENPLAIRLETEDGVHYRKIARTVRYDGDGVQIDRITAVVGGDCSDEVLGDPTNAAAVCVHTSTEASVTVDGAPAQGRIALLAEGPNTVVAQVGDARDSLVLTRDAEGPALVVEPVETSPAAEAVLRGTVTDPSGIAALRVADPSGTIDDVPIASPFEIPVSLAPGPNTLHVIAIDGAGNRTDVAVNVRRGRTFTFADPLPSGTQLTLTLDRDALEALVPEADQKELVLANVDLRPAMVNAFAAIKDPFEHDVDVSKWTQKQWNANAILNITPDNIDISGTLMEPLMNVSEAVGLPPSRILAETFGIATTDPILAGSQIVDSLIDNVVGTHPNAQFDPETGRPIFVLTLYDVLRNLETLGERLGPVDGHPGLVGGGGTHGELVEPGFAMNITATSQFTRYDGVDASQDAKDFLYRLPPDTPAAVFDFEDPSTFTIVGMKDEPTIDFEFQLNGILQHIDVGTERFANPAPEEFGEGFYFGNSEAWSIPRYYDERILTESAFRTYHLQFADTGYHYVHVYDAGNIDAVATVTWDRGWLDIQTKGGLGDPPPAGYIWDFLLDVVQARSLDGGLEPEEYHIAFPMHAIPVGLDADHLIELLRPTLQEQAVQMSDVLVGREQIVASAVDFTFEPGFLVFRAPEDSEADYVYDAPGFFADAALEARVSTVVDGHERAPMTAGATYFFEDEAGDVYRVDVVDDHTITLLPTEAP